MKRTPVPRRIPFLLLLLLFAAGPAVAQNAPSNKASSAHTDMSQSGMTNAGEMGRHAMPATVTSTDPKTGTVDVNAGGMALKVHFPPAAMASLKAGDQITLHLAYSKP